MKRTGFFFSALFIFLSFFLFAQDLEYEVGVLDLNTKPKSGKDLENVLVVGDNIFYTVESSPKFDLYRFDGHQKQLLLSNHGEITFLQPFKNGFFLETEISPSNEHLLYYYDIETSVFHQLIDAYYNTVVRLTILGDKVIFAAVFGVYTTDGSAEGTHQLRRFPSPFYRSDFHSAKTDSLVIFSTIKNPPATNCGKATVQRKERCSLNQVRSGMIRKISHSMENVSSFQAIIPYLMKKSGLPTAPLRELT